MPTCGLVPMHLLSFLSPVAHGVTSWAGVWEQRLADARQGRKFATNMQTTGYNTDASNI